MNKTKLIQWIWLVSVAVFFAALTVQIHNADERLYGPNTNEQSSVANPVLSKTQPRYNSDSESKTTSIRILGKVTQYSKVETCPNRACITASGTVAKAFITAACPRKYKFGTEIEIAGHRYTCQDRTALRYDGRWDIYAGDTLADYESAINFGLQTLEITIYEL